MSIMPLSTVLSTIVVEDLPSGKQKFGLPGGNGEVSVSQQSTLVRYAVDNFASSMTWGDALAAMRSKFLFSAKGQDWMMLEPVFAEIRRASADEPFSTRQIEMLVTNTQCLSGEKPHWDAGIQAKVSAAPAVVRNAHWARFSSVLTRTDLDIAIQLFTASFGRPAKRSGDDESARDASGAKGDEGF